MKKIAFCSLLFFFLASLFAPVQAAIGQSAVPTLVWPFGARSEAMGEVGTALCDDESVLYFNPAGLDVPNDRWWGGAGTYFNQPLLPSFRLSSLYQTGVAANFQDSSLYWGAPGVFLNYSNNGNNELIGGLQPGDDAILALGWGFDFKDAGLKNHYFGLTLKGFESTIDGFSAHSFAVDFGYLWAISNNFRFGATFMNMGPSISYEDPQLREPIPFTINFALGYKNRFNNPNFPCKVAGEFRFDREVVTNNGDGNPPSFLSAIGSDLLHDTYPGENTFSEQMQEWVEHIGGEITYANTVNLRCGYLMDIADQRYEWHEGFGLTLLNHFSLDYSYIHSPEGYIPSFVRKFGPELQGSNGDVDGQWEISLTFMRVLN